MLARTDTPRRTLTGLASWLWLLLLAVGPAMAATPILIVHSYSQEYAWTRGQHEGFIDALKTDPGLTPVLSTEYLDTKRRPYDAAYAQSMADHLRVKYAGYRPAAIYVSDDNALLFARDHLRRLFPAAPVFFSGVNDHDTGEGLDRRHFTGVFENKEVRPNLDWLMHLDPNLRDLVFVGDGSNTHAAIEAAIRKDLAAYPRLRGHFIGETRLDRVLAELRDRPAHTLFLTTLGGMTDAKGGVLPLSVILRAMSQGGRRRVISMEDVYVAEGVLGGYVTHGPRQGAGAARLLLDYMRGKPLTDIQPVRQSPNAYLFDDTVLEARKLVLPMDIARQATLLRPRPDFIDAHRTLIGGGFYGLAALLILAVLAGLIVRTRKNRALMLARADAEKSGQLLREAVSSIAQGFTIYDENDRLMVCNEAYKEFYEASRDLIVPGNSFEEIVRRGAERGQYAEATGHIDEWVAKRVAQHQAADGRVIEQQLGDGRWLLIVEHRTPSGYIVGNRIDISELKGAYLALRKSEERANQIVENSPDPILLVGANGRILQLNNIATKIFGYGHKELLGQPIEILVPDSARDAHKQHRDEYAKAPRVRPMGSRRTIEARCKDGRNLPVEISLAPLDTFDDARQIIVAIRDKSESVQAAAVVADRNAQLGALFQLSPDGLVSFDRAGRVKNANAALSRMMGLSTAEIIGQSQDVLERRLRELAQAPEQWPGLEACFVAQKVGAGGTAPQGQRHLLALRRPRATVLELVGATSEAATVGRLLYVSDVSHEIEVDRMKSEFLSHAAHELRTPMASIYGFTELLMSQEFDAATRRDLLATIHKQTEWLVNIINELLDLSRIEARRGMDFVIEAVPLAPLVREVVEALRIDAARWPVSVEIADDMPVARADAAKLRQALTNVLGNAVKYSPAGGAITVCGVLRAVDGNSRVGIAVTDHGIGMTPEQIARVGERFYRADTSGNIPGSGLGMAIVKEIVLLLGGSLDIASTPREGTTAILWVPVFGAVGDQPAGPLSTESFQEKS
ncbi:MAG: PAS domain S-box protein [Sulfuritalea sp.]|jgi:PAS domain S-box-containing protein|nr:PAS domain S-box protein [Sulfuritalea sp.]